MANDDVAEIVMMSLVLAAVFGFGLLLAVQGARITYWSTVALRTVFRQSAAVRGPRKTVAIFVCWAVVILGLIVWCWQWVVSFYVGVFNIMVKALNGMAARP